MTPGTGMPVSIMDATMITAARTGAMTAVGARFRARPDARILGHVGARGTAFWNVVLLDAEFDLAEIRVTSRRPESREAFAAELAAVTATPVRVTATADEAESQSGRFGALRRHVDRGALSERTLHAELAPRAGHPGHRARPADPGAGAAGRRRHDTPLPVARAAGMPAASGGG
ncbi:MAG TPA: hypothetical protein VK586_07970 [Streptosporangiaceae bacterium]|nr:hypothetical protein [Streptosporangiaceae bacterium]